MKEYTHKVHYYETDKMGVTHHSNYIRWMEEARVHYLDEIGFGYNALEKSGIISPVIGIEGDYKMTTTFDDIINIKVGIKEFKGVKLVISYVMTNAKTGDLVFSGISKHCFLNKDNKPVILKKDYPDFDSALKNLIEKQ